jgi:hypothetical protein
MFLRDHEHLVVAIVLVRCGRGKYRQTQSMAKKSACKTSGPHPTGSSLPTALQLVSALTEEQHQTLKGFAAKRMRRLRAAPGMERCLGGKSPEELVHDAFEKVLQGDSHPRKGRKLSAKNRQSTDAFIDCVRGIINSDLSNLVRSFEVSVPHVPLGDPEAEPDTVELSDPGNFVRQLEQRDTQRELFVRLEQLLQNEPALEPIIRHWHEHYQVSDRIAGPEFDVNLVYRVRQHAQRILHELAKEGQANDVTGMEMLL